MPGASACRGPATLSTRAPCAAIQSRAIAGSGRVSRSRIRRGRPYAHGEPRGETGSPVHGSAVKDQRGIRVAHVPSGALTVGARRRLAQRITPGDGSVLRPPPPGAPAADLQPRLDGRIERGAVHAALAAADHPDGDPRAPRRRRPIGAPLARSLRGGCARAAGLDSQGRSLRVRPRISPILAAAEATKQSETNRTGTTDSGAALVTRPRGPIFAVTSDPPARSSKPRPA